jgi:hypothetical protein
MVLMDFAEQDAAMDTTAMLELSDGSVALIDREDMPRVLPWEWRLPASGGSRFAVGSQCDERGVCADVLLHRLIANAGPDDVVLHRNRNTLDNRRENLLVLGRVSLPAWVPAPSLPASMAD